MKLDRILIFVHFSKIDEQINVEYAGQTSEDFERRIGMMETSLNRFGMIMDSVQSDIIQVKKGTKEALMESKYLLQNTLWKNKLLRGNYLIL